MSHDKKVKAERAKYVLENRLTWVHYLSYVGRISMTFRQIRERNAKTLCQIVQAKSSLLGKKSWVNKAMTL